MATRLIEVPPNWANGGDLYCRFNGVSLFVRFGDDEDDPAFEWQFDWVRSFRFISEATYDRARDAIEDSAALLAELPLPNGGNPSNDYYGDRPEAGKTAARLFRVFHYKAGLIEVVASSVCTVREP